MDDNKEFDDWAIFQCVLLIVGGGKLPNIEESSLAILGYQLLPLATSKLMGDNTEFDDSAKFWSVLVIVDRGKLQNIEDSSLVILGYELLPLATSKLWVIIRNLDILRCFTYYWRGKSPEHWRFIIGHPWLSVVAPNNQQINGW